MARKQECIAFVNGRVLTMESAPSEVEALLTRGERIAAVGNTSEVLALAPAGTKIMDLGGRVLSPGFVDAHTHFVSHGLDLSRPDLLAARDVDQALEIVREAARQKNPSKPLIAVNWDESRWKDPRRPTLIELDKVVGSHPVILRRICGHVAVANSAALRLLPPGLKWVDRRRGLLFEYASLHLNRIFPPDADQILCGLSRAMDAASQMGVTSIHDMACLRYFEIYQRIHRQHGLRVRVYISLPCEEMGELITLKEYKRSRNEWLRIGGIKIFSDGSLGARTAALSRPYRRSSGLGTLNFTFDELLEIMADADAHGLQLFVHAIGDQAISQVLAAFEYLLAHGNPLRHRIEHFEVATRAHIRTLTKLRIIASLQPNFVSWQDPGGMYQRLLGVRRSKMANRIGDIVRAGVKVAFGSDCMPFSPQYGLSGAVSHPSSGQRIEPADALHAYTIGSAYASFDERVKGSLVRGKLADLVVWAENPLLSRNLKNGKILLTMVGGQITHLDWKRLRITQKS
ncbi:hypothetical protein AMJ40_00960 [candidate division TA06 bacterium DG_26]|uniref:Amidohydrolase 3 domain-containing protein n=1 Tax=candidate division TA06 bacterium DG_26 TaxID=1703771 RepID=A0A0S7WLQ1_UNCT6|nr:MAG: hypothetical protein AMJ40_00960 [candidate division TA06 bacterium DG_26]